MNFQEASICAIFKKENISFESSDLFHFIIENVLALASQQINGGIFNPEISRLKRYFISKNCEIRPKLPLLYFHTTITNERDALRVLILYNLNNKINWFEPEYRITKR